MNPNSSPENIAPEVVAIGDEPLRIEQVLRLAKGTARARLSEHPAYRERLARGVALLEQHLAEGRAVYGVTTGVGDSCETELRGDLMRALPLNLLRMHGCGTGRLLTEVESAAVVAARLASVGRGYSAVRPVVLERLCDLLNARLLPCIPAEGSVGASGDLTPLSYVAAVLVGERELLVNGVPEPAERALRQAGLSPLQLGPKESLALMNGTSVMTGLACLAVESAQRLARLASALTAMASDVLFGEPRHFDDRIFALKPHPGQRTCARWIREDIDFDAPRNADTARIQDRYSIRCAPHVIGVLLDALPHVRQTVEVELNSVNDNPLFDLASGEVLHSGNFYGGHICQVMDTLKACVASVADLLDRQLCLLCTPSMSNGLPANLVHQTDGSHHGFKAMQISTSALTAEALKLTMPAVAFSRSTENHNQDKVSMGTIAARDALRVLELTETVASIHTLALCQAVDLRAQRNCHTRSLAIHTKVRSSISMNSADRRMDTDIAQVLTWLRNDELPVGNQSNL